MTKILLSAVILAASSLALAKLPPPDPAAKAKAAEKAAKAAWQAKVDAYQLCKVQDKIAAQYGDKGKAGASAARSGQQSAAGAAPSTGTPVAFKPPPPCAEPGPFAYNPPEQTPLETSEAHSPAGNATSPPSVRSESGKMAPAK